MSDNRLDGSNVVVLYSPDSTDAFCAAWLLHAAVSNALYATVPPWFTFTTRIDPYREDGRQCSQGVPIGALRSQIVFVLGAMVHPRELRVLDQVLIDNHTATRDLHFPRAEAEEGKLVLNLTFDPLNPAATGIDTSSSVAMLTWRWLLAYGIRALGTGDGAPPPLVQYVHDRRDPIPEIENSRNFAQWDEWAYGLPNTEDSATID